MRASVLKIENGFHRQRKKEKSRAQNIPVVCGLYMYVTGGICRYICPAFA